jgi:exopolyphosphatase/guanosine-5'-triphosphate,3'-diphosphate pyrophosphatase
MINIKKYAAIWVKCYAFINSQYRRTGGKRAQFNKSSLVRVPIRLGQDAYCWRNLRRKY